MDRPLFGVCRRFPWMLGLLGLIAWRMALATEECVLGCSVCASDGSCTRCSKFLDAASGKCIESCPPDQIQVTNNGRQCRLHPPESSSGNDAVLIGVCSGGAVLFLVIVTGIMYFHRSRDEKLQSSLYEVAQKKKRTQDYSHLNGGFEPDSIGPQEFRTRIFDLKPELSTYVSMLKEVKQKTKESKEWEGGGCPYRTTFIELTRFILLLKSNVLNVSVGTDSRQFLDWAEQALQRYKESNQMNNASDGKEKRVQQSSPDIIITEPQAILIPMEMDAIPEDELPAVPKDGSMPNQGTENVADQDLKEVRPVFEEPPQIPEVDYELPSGEETPENEIQDTIQDTLPTETHSIVSIPEADLQDTIQDTSLPTETDSIISIPEADLQDTIQDTSLPTETHSIISIPEADLQDTVEAKEMDPHYEVLLIAGDLNQIPLPPDTPHDNSITDVNHSNSESQDVPAANSFGKPTDETEESPVTPRLNLLGQNQRMGFSVSPIALRAAREGLRPTNNEAEKVSLPLNMNRRQKEPLPSQEKSHRQRAPQVEVIAEPPSAEATDDEEDTSL